MVITPEKRASRELERAIKALQASGHNPIEWTSIIKFIAPLIARIASRYALKLIARKLDRRIGSKVREETILQTADHLADIAIKRTTGAKKK